MTPAERGLLLAMAQIVCEGTGRLRLIAMMNAVKAEDLRRPYAERMPDEQLSEYNELVAAKEPEPQ